MLSLLLGFCNSISNALHGVINGYFTLGHTVNRSVYRKRKLRIPSWCTGREKWFNRWRLRNKRFAADESSTFLQISQSRCAGGQNTIGIIVNLEFF